LQEFLSWSDYMKNKIIMVYPTQGFSGTFVRHAPLSLLYASIELVKHGIEVEVLDNRLYPTSWMSRLRELLTPDVLAVGVSVMSGKPILNAVEIGRLVKTVDPNIAVVWGGPHATFFSESVLEQEWSCDFVVSGYAVQSFYELIVCLQNHREPAAIAGATYRKGKDIVHVPRDDTKFEHIDYRDIPYNLISDYSLYGQLEQKKIIFSMYSALGCPYKCAFCSAPAEYTNIQGKLWVPLNIVEVVDHIEYVMGRYGASYIYFIDDDSFVDLKHVESIIDEINRRDIKVELGFRGARINEIKHMTSDFLDKLAHAGTDILHIGAESGSDRLLQLVHKNCTVADIIECNRKLAKHPAILAAYNFIVGLPTETMDDLKATRDLMLRLVDDNPRCIIFQPNKFRPIPGTELFNLAQKTWHYVSPKTMAEWGNIEAEGDLSSPWYPQGMKEFCDLMLVTSYFIDNKVNKISSGDTVFYKLLRVASVLYGPVARFRLKHGLYQCLLEYWIYKVVTRVLREKPSDLTPTGVAR